MPTVDAYSGIYLKGERGGREREREREGGREGGKGRERYSSQSSSYDCVPSSLISCKVLSCSLTTPTLCCSSFFSSLTLSSRFFLLRFSLCVSRYYCQRERERERERENFEMMYDVKNTLIITQTSGGGPGIAGL
jgi:hypothetical protein